MGWKYRAAWMHDHAEEIEQLVRHIQEHGPVRSADFEHAQKGVSGWWEWKPHKRHLEGYSPPEKSWWLSGVIFNAYMI